MSLKSHFKFNQQVRSGIFFLLLIIVVLQIGYFLSGMVSNDGSLDKVSLDMELLA